MKVDFIRFKASDDVELQGWLTDADSKTATIHIHGMCGNGYENSFLDSLRDMYSKNDIAFFSIDTRGRGIISDFKQGNGSKHAGSCFEIFEESIHDIQGAIDYLKSIGKSKFILQGHSLGCTKIVNYVLNNDTENIEKVILLAPTDMVGWSSNDPEHDRNTEKAKALLAEGKGEELIGAQCWPLDNTPLSAQAYYSKSAKGSAVDMYSPREGGALLGRVEEPMIIPYGTADIGITEIDGDMDSYIGRVGKIKNNNTQIKVIEGASHGFGGYESVLTKAIEGFIK